MLWTFPCPSSFAFSRSLLIGVALLTFVDGWKLRRVVLLLPFLLGWLSRLLRGGGTRTDPRRLGPPSLHESGEFECLHASGVFGCPLALGLEFGSLHCGLPLEVGCIHTGNLETRLCQAKDFLGIYRLLEDSLTLIILDEFEKVILEPCKISQDVGPQLIVVSENNKFSVHHHRNITRV